MQFEFMTPMKFSRKTKNIIMIVPGRHTAIRMAPGECQIGIMALQKETAEIVLTNQKINYDHL